MRCAGASCRQLWVTAGAQSRERERERERGAFSDFPISPGRVRRTASTLRPTADRDDDMRPAYLEPTFVPASPRRPEAS